MKSKIQPTQHEIVLADSDFIVSKTDLTGRITYANRIFMRIANFSERELLGVQHNIVRHPDMPRGAYRLMWETLKRGEEFFAFVKNMTADGNYYWVFANVTPDRGDDGQTVGYFSVRRKVNAEALRTVIPLYQQMQQIEREAGAARAPDASMSFLQDKLRELGTDYDRLVLSLQHP